MKLESFKKSKLYSFVHVIFLICTLFSCGKGFNLKITKQSSGTQSQTPPTSAQPKTQQPLSISLFSLGDSFTCGASPISTSSRDVRCWGKNDVGQLGTNLAANPQTTPYRVTGLTSQVLSMSAGIGFGCLLSANNIVKCWGNNDQNQLGSASGNSSFPQVVRDPYNDTISKLQVGFSATCYTLSSGNVQCVGQNLFGNLGTSLLGANASSFTPVDINTLPLNNTKVVQYQNNNGSSFALLSDGSIWCTSNGTLCSLATTVFLRQTNLPSSPITQILNGNGIHCILTAINEVYCKGSNTSYQLADGTNTTRTDFTLASLFSSTNPRRLADSYLTSNNSSLSMCIINAAGQIKCIGWNGSGTLGNNSAVSPQITVTDVVDGTNTPLSGFTRLSQGLDFMCALNSGGQVWCWGNGTSGQLGVNSTSNSTVAQRVTLPEKTKVLSVGSNHSCVILESGKVMCWGAGSAGQIGNNSTANALVPTYVQNLPEAEDLMVGSSFSCAQLTNKNIRCWGRNNVNQLGHPDTTLNRLVPNIPFPYSIPLKQASAIASGTRHTCILYDGSVKCFGRNNSGQLGNGTTSNNTSPQYVNNLPEFIQQIAAGDNFSCFLGRGGFVYCTGDNSFGQLGNLTTINQSLPAPVTNLSGIVGITAGQNHACAITSSGSLQCWGDNKAGQLGNGNQYRQTAPVAVKNIPEKIAQVSAGLGHTCAVSVSGKAYCWGSNDSGQLGTNNYGLALTPVLVSGFENMTIKTIQAGNTHTCATNSNNELYCWGANESGQLGNNSTTFSPIPVIVRNH